MKVQISSMDNGSGLIDTLQVMGDYNPQNKVFNKWICNIEFDDFIECFAEDNKDKIIEDIEKGKIVFDVNKQLLQDNCNKWFN